ncbi:MAG: TIGR00282 family metallophosphoesterase [Planctomycetota bacterium]|nr:TIGR00282 family metallophosphoesterase [Planctomycetota bacterium]
MPTARIMILGDIVGRPGRAAATRLIPKLIQESSFDIVVVNGENAAGGSGISLSIAKKLLVAGADVITTGDHFFRNKEYVGCLDEPRILRPANMPAQAVGRGYGVYTSRNGIRFAVINLQGRIFMEPHCCPFKTADRILAEIGPQTRLVLVDMHAEATSEKIAMGWHLDGRVTCVFGTHTHIQTADERILPGGTAYITDLGMTGPYDSVIGRVKEAVLKKFRTGVPTHYDVATGDVRLSGIEITSDRDSGTALSIRRLHIPFVPDPGAPEE